MKSILITSLFLAFTRFNMHETSIIKWNRKAKTMRWGGGGEWEAFNILIVWTIRVPLHIVLNEL